MAVTLRAAGTAASGTTSVSPSSPASAAAGDYLLAFIVDHNTSGSTTPPTGWTLIGGAAGTGGRFQVFSAVVGQGGLTGTSWTWSSLTSRSESVIIAFTGQWTSPLDGTLTAQVNATGTTGTTAVTTTTAGDLIVGAFAGLASGNTWSGETTATAGALSEIFDSANSTFCSIAVATRTQAAAGTTGASSATMGTAGANGGILLAIKAAPVLTTLAVTTTRPTPNVSNNATVTMGSALAVTTTRPQPAVYPETSPALELSGFGTFSDVGASDTIEHVTVTVAQFQSSAPVGPPAVQLWDGASAQIGATQTGTDTTSSANVDTFTFTGVSVSQLPTLRVRIYANSGTAAAGATQSVDAVSVTVSYTRYSSPYPAVLAVATTQPAVTVSPKNVTVTPAVLAVAAAVPQAGTGIQPVGLPAGGPWVLAWADEFNDPAGTSLPDPATWADHFTAGDIWRTNNTNELEWYPHSKRGLSVSGSICSLTARFENPQTFDPACPSPLQPGGQAGTFTSGLIQSHPGFQATYGYFEALMLWPSNVPFAWPAFWMYDATGGWNDEFDIAEDSTAGDAFYTSTYMDTGSWHGISTVPLPDWNTPGWHVYGLAWLPGGVYFYQDGVQTFSYTATTTTLPSHIVFNLAVQAGATGTGYPCALQIDYVRYWQFTGVPAQPHITSVVPADGVPVAGTLQVNFTGGSGAASFRATTAAVDGAADSWVPALNSATGAASPLTVTGLTNGVRYTATVAGLNPAGYSVESGIWPMLPGMPVSSPPGPVVTTAFPPASVTPGASARPVTVTFPAAVVTAGGNASVNAATLTVTTTLPAATVVASAAVSPATLAVTGTVTFSAAGSSVSITLVADNAVTVTTAFPQAVVTVGAGNATAAPAALAVTAAASVPLVRQDAPIAPAVLAVTTTFPAAAISSAAAAAPAALAITTTRPGPAINTPATLAVTTTRPAPAVSAGATAAPAALAVTTTTPVPSVSAGGNATITVTTVTVTAVLTVPVVRQDRTITAVTLTVTIIQPAVTVRVPARPGTLAVTVTVRAAAVLTAPRVATALTAAATRSTLAAGATRTSSVTVIAAATLGTAAAAPVRGTIVTAGTTAEGSP